jgi:hypothetical protein
MGWGVVQYRTALPYFPTPTPIPSPQGGGEECAVPANHILGPTGLCVGVTGGDAYRAF